MSCINVTKVQFYLRQPGNVAPDIQVGESPVTVGRGSCPNITDKCVSTEHVESNNKRKEPMTMAIKLMFKKSVPPVEETKSDIATTPSPSNNKRKKPRSIAQAKFLYQKGRTQYGYDYYR